MTAPNKKILWSPKLHKWLGIILLAPLCVWAITGGIFLIKPGYDKAYEKLSIRTYSTEAESSLVHERTLEPDWQQYRRMNTVIGEHLLVQRNDQWQQLDLATGQPRLPHEHEVRQLMQDAFYKNPQRYGRIQKLDNLEAVTDTQVVVTLDWDQMSLRQRGEDTRMIQWFYRLHYLQWSGHEKLDRAFGFLGLFFLITLTMLGVRLLFLRPVSK